MSFTQEPANTELASPSSYGVSRRSFLKLVIAAGGTAATASALPTVAAAAETPTAYPEKFTFAVMSDVHYLSPKLIAQNAAYEIAENSDRKMFSESADILARALEVVVEQAPDMVIVPGDLTKDGEYVCHEEVAALYKQAQERIAEATGKQTKFYVINGNHDLNNHHAKDFAQAGAEDTVAPDAQRTNPTEYKTDIWADFGYPEATAFFDKEGTRDGSLSYVVRPCPGLTLIVVDSCSYNLDGGDGTLAQETQDGMTQELLDWVCAQAKAAKAAGDVVIATQHHGVVEHFGYEDEIFGEYLVNKNLSYTAVAEAYADAGISAVFTGHMHANDIAKHTSAAGNTVYDIETGSLVTYPSHMRVGSFEFAQKGETLECTMTVDDQPLGAVDFDLASQGGLVEVDSADITAYGKERTLTVDSIQTMLGGMFVQPLLAQYAPLGIKGIVATLLPSLGGDAFAGVTADNLNATVWNLITTQVLPQGFEVGIVIPDVKPIGDVHIYYNAETARIEAWTVTETEDVAAIADVTYTLPEEASRQFAAELAQVPATVAVEPNVCLLYITQETFEAFLEKTYGEIDLEALSAEGQAKLLSIVNLLVRLLITAAVDKTPHSLLDLVDFCYQAHLMGCENTEGWVETAIEAIPGESGLLANVVASGVNAGLADQEFVDFATSIELDAKTLLKSDVFLIGSIAINMVAGMMENVKALLDTVVDMAGLDLGATLAGLVTGLSLFNDEPLPTTAHNALYYLVNDENVNGASADETDHHLVATATATIPVEEKPSKNELQDTIGSAEKVETAGASSDAVKEFEAALAAAQAVMNDPDATEAEISAAQARLANAIKAVEESKAQGGSGQGGNGGSNKPNNTGKPAGDKLVGTGDASMAASLAALLAGGGTIAAGIWARMTGRGDQE